MTSTHAERHRVSPLTPRNQVFRDHTWLLCSFCPGSAGFGSSRPPCVFRMDTSVGIEVSLQTCPHETTPAFGARTCCRSYSLFRILSGVRNNDVSLCVSNLSISSGRWCEQPSCGEGPWLLPVALCLGSRGVVAFRAAQSLLGSGRATSGSLLQRHSRDSSRTEDSPARLFPGCHFPFG